MTSPHRYDRTTAIYPLPLEVGALLDAHGVDRDGFQDVIRAAQPFVPMLQRSECIVLAMTYVEASDDAAAAIARARTVR